MMSRTITSLIGVLLLAYHAYGSRCPEHELTTRHVLCYYEGRTSLNSVNLCNCTHIVLTNVVRVADNYSLDFVEDGEVHLKHIAERKQSLTRIFTINWRDNLKPNIFESENKSQQLINGISNFLGSSGFNGVELNLPFTAQETVSKDDITYFLKTLKKTLENLPHVRVKREGYDVSEKVQDDITTAPYRTLTTKRNAEKGNKKAGGKRRKSYRTSRRKDQEDEEEVIERKAERAEERSRRMRKELRENQEYQPNALLLVRLPINPEVIAKKFDLKAMSKYSDFLVLSTHNITDDSERSLTYHPSRLMGLSDMLNADSILDFLSGLGVPKSKIILTLPATILKFQLEDPKKTTPRSPRLGEPESIDQSQLCLLFDDGNWTVERDDDLTAPYAFSGKTWLAYEDRVSVNIKAKYILLRELGGGAIYPIDADTGREPCNDTSAEVGFLTNTLFKNIISLDRKPRGLVLESLQEDIHDTSYSTAEAGVHLSEYRIVRVVDHSGAVHVIRKNTKTQFECSRQGYFSHPLGCNKFYRCVKFNQYTDDFTVFEYDCPAGLAFDERWEVCVWPGSLPHGAPCTGSSEIAPVPRSHYQCPIHEGYYADPENCRWFFACLDHARDGVTPLTAYEFRCPFGLVFNEQNLACDWPWNVGACGNRGFSGVVVEHYGGSSASVHSATFVNSASHGSGFGAHQGGTVSGFSSHQGSASNFDAYQEGVASGFGISQREQASGFAHSSQYNEHQRGTSVFGGSFAGSGYITGHFEDSGERASFGNLPEHEISGGRILNKGGVVLNQNVNFHSGLGSGRESGSFEAAHVSVATPTPIVSTVETRAPVPVIPKSKEIVYDHPLPSSSPFSAHVPEVQVNQEHYPYVAASTTPRVGTYQNSNSGSHGGVNVFTVSTGSDIQSQEDGAFGEKFNAELVHGRQNFIASGTQISSPSPIDVQDVHSFSGGYQGVSGISATTAGYESNSNPFRSVDINPRVHQQQNFASGAVFTGSSSTATPITTFQRNFAGKQEAIFVTPKPETHSFQLQKANFHSTNGSSLVHLSTEVPFTVSGSLDQSLGLKHSGYGNGVLLEEKIERVVIPKFRPSLAPSLHGVTYNQETVSAKSVISDSGTKFTAALSPAAVAVQHQEFVGPIQLSTPAPFSLPRETVRESIVTTTSPPLFKAAEYLPPALGTAVVQENIQLFNPALQTELQQTIRTPGPVVLTKTGRDGGRLNSGITVAKPGVQFVSTPAPAVFNVAVDQGRVDSGYSVKQQTKLVQPAIQFASTPAPAVFKTAEYLTPVQSGVVVQEKVNLFKPSIQTKFVQPVSGIDVQDDVNLYKPAVQTKLIDSKPAPPVLKQAEYVSESFGEHASSKLNVLKGTSAPAVFKAAEYLPPVVQTEFLQPLVSTSAPKVFKKPIFIPTHVDDVKPAAQISTAAPSVFKGPEYLPPVQNEIVVSTGSQQNFGGKSVVQTKVVQPVVSTPGPAVSGVAVNQGRVDIKSNVQTYSQVPVFQDVKFVQSTPSPAVFKAAGYLPPLQSGAIVQENVSLHKSPVKTQFVQPVSTPAPAVFRKPEFVAIEQVKPAVQYSSTPVPVFKGPSVIAQGPVVNQQPVIKQVHFVPTPAPAIFKGQEYFSSVQEQSVELKADVQEKVQDFSHTPVIEEAKIAQPVLSTRVPEVVPVQQSYKTKQFVQIPIRQSYSFVPSVPSSYVFEEKQISSQQNVFNNRPKAKQLLSTALQPQVSYEVFNKAITTPATIELKSTSPTQTEIFNYQSAAFGVSTPQTIDVTPKTIHTVQQDKIVASVERTTAKPYVYEEYVEVSPLKQGFSEERFKQPIVVAEQPRQNALQETLIQGNRNEFKNVYLENYQRSNPAITTLEKEIIQPVVQQKYQVSSELPLVVNSAAESAEYYPATGEEIDNHSNFEFQKIVKSSANQARYKINSNIEIAPPPAEYVITASPKVITSTVSPIQTTSAHRVRARPVTTTAAYEYEKQSRRGKTAKATIISVGQVDKEELEDDNVESLLEKYSGDFGNVLGREKFVTKIVQGEERGEFAIGEGGSSTVGYDVSTSRSRNRYKSTYKEEEMEDASIASLDLKNLRLKKNKKTVIIVSQVSDANPLLIGKLAGQCSCQSNHIQVNRKTARLNSQSKTTSMTFHPPIEDEPTSERVLDSLAIEAVAPSTENIILIDGSRSAGKPSRFRSGRKRPAGRSRYEEVSENDVRQAILSPVPAAEIASTADYSVIRKNGLDEILQGGVECERPGLFRHPKYCNKFYACNYDPWKKKYTLHMFNCPIHLSYDSSISACNWPSKGPACSDDHLLI